MSLCKLTDPCRAWRTHLCPHWMSFNEETMSYMVKDLMDQIDRKEEQLRKVERTITFQVGHLREALEERKNAFKSLAEKLSMTESELVLAEQKASDHSAVINRLKQDMAEMAQRHQTEIKKEKEACQERAQVEKKHRQELLDLQDKHLHSQIKCDDLDRKCRQQQEQIFELKEQLTHLHAELKLKGSQFEEQLASEKQRHKQMLRDLEATKNKELEHLKQEAENNARALQESIRKTEAHCQDLDKEISRLKSSSLVDKLNAEEQLQSAKQRIKAEEEQRQRQLEKRMQVLQMSEDELQTHSNQQALLVTELQSKNCSLTLEVENLKRRLEVMGQELAEKNFHMMAEVGKVKAELNQSISKLEGECSGLKDKLAQANKALSDKSLRHKQAMEEKERELITVQEKLHAREKEIQRAQEEEMQRAQKLQIALMSYLSRLPK